MRALLRKLIMPGALALGCSSALALPMECGDLRASFGPFDYRTISTSDRLLVENSHFQPKVETLKEGHTARLPGPDISYTLAVMPNHPRALLSMERLSIKEKTLKPFGSRYTVECYFLRAIEFTPTDPLPHLIYGMFLKDQKRKDEAVGQASQVEALRGEPTGFELDYNLGLLYVELGMVDKAKHYADNAYALGATFPGLRNRIQSMEGQRR